MSFYEIVRTGVLDPLTLKEKSITRISLRCNTSDSRYSHTSWSTRIFFMVLYYSTREWIYWTSIALICPRLNLRAHPLVLRRRRIVAISAEATSDCRETPRRAYGTHGVLRNRVYLALYYVLYVHDWARRYASGWLMILSISLALSIQGYLLYGDARLGRYDL